MVEPLSTARRKGRQQICSNLTHRATSRLYQSRHFDRGRSLPVYPGKLDNFRAGWHFAFVPHRKSVDSRITSSVHSSLPKHFAQGRHFGLDGLLEKRSRAVAQDSVSGSAKSS